MSKSTQNSKVRYLCVRHGTKRKDSKLTSFFLCDKCYQVLRSTAFNNYQPAYIIPGTEYIEGYCLYCGKDVKVRQYFYFLCEICERIIHSYGKEWAARNYVLKWWKELCQRYEIDLKLRVEDPVTPMSFKEHEKLKRKERSPRPDFAVMRDSQIIFAIEMKTGRSNIKEMSSFQLDKSDCDDILAFLQTQYKVPTFLFHVQVLEDYKPPTFRYVVINAWWSSLYDLEKNFMASRVRSRERRLAIYYNKDAFKPISEFVNYILGGGLEGEKKLLSERLPVLYK